MLPKMVTNDNNVVRCFNFVTILLPFSVRCFNFVTILLLFFSNMLPHYYHLSPFLVICYHFVTILLPFLVTCYHSVTIFGKMLPFYYHFVTIFRQHVTLCYHSPFTPFCLHFTARQPPISFDRTDIFTPLGSCNCDVIVTFDPSIPQTCEPKSTGENIQDRWIQLE